MQEQVGKIENAHAVLQMRLKWIEKKEKKTKKKLNRKETLTSGLEGTMVCFYFWSSPLSFMNGV